MLKVLKWNCASVRARKDELLKIIDEHRPQVVVLSETCLTAEIAFNLQGYNIARKDRINSHGGVLIACATNLRATRISITTNSERVACRIEVDQHIALNIASIYFPPSFAVSRTGMDNLIQQIDPPRLLVGDFNAHGQQWGGAITDRRASMLTAFFDDKDLTTLNTGEITRVACPPIRPSAIDLSVCSANITLGFTWRVLDHPHGSDHLPILLTYSYGSTPVATVHSSAIKISKIDWDQYNNLVQIGLLNKIQEIQSSTEKYAKLVEMCAELTRLYVTKKQAFS